MADVIFNQRLEKFDKWRELGFEPYGKSFDRTHKSVEAKQEVEENAPREASEVLNGPKSDSAMCGRIMTMRDMGKLAFLTMRDEGGDFQICFSKEILGDKYKPLLKALDMGDYCGFKGEFFITRHGEPTLLAAEVTPLAKSLRPLPEKWHGLQDKEACYRERNIDLMTNPETFKRFKMRSDVVREIREFFHEKDFMEVETRVLQPMAGGAMAKVFSTHHNALDHEFVLRIALELELKIACSGGFERIFEIGKNFRNEGIDPSHLQEFTMLEWYAAYRDLQTNMEWTEELLRRICTNVLGTTKVEILDKDEKPVEVDFGKKFAEARFPDLIKEYAGLDMFTATDDEVRAKAMELGVKDVEGVGRANLLDDIYKKTARPMLVEPTFVFDYPEDLKPLARPKGDGTADVFQLLVGGWEIVNSYGELVNPVVQRELLERQSAAKAGGDEEAMEVDEVFLRAMEHGFPPMTGSGIGIDRLCCLLAGQPNLRDVVLFPTMKPKDSHGSGSSPKKKGRETRLAVAVINKAAIKEKWEVANAYSHLAAALGAREGRDLFMQDTITTKDDKEIFLNIQHAILNKECENQDALMQLLDAAREKGLRVSEFTREMISTTDDRKVARNTAEKNHSEVEFLGGLIFGKKSMVDELTKSFKFYSA